MKDKRPIITELTVPRVMSAQEILDSPLFSEKGKAEAMKILTNSPRGEHELIAVFPEDTAMVFDLAAECLDHAQQHVPHPQLMGYFIGALMAIFEMGESTFCGAKPDAVRFTLDSAREFYLKRMVVTNRPEPESNPAEEGN